MPRIAAAAAAACVSFVATLSAAAQAPSPTSVDAVAERFTREASFDDIALSPTGEYLAASIPQGEKTILVVMRRADRAVTSAFRMEGKTHVTDFWWVNPTRLLLAVGQTSGALEAPRPTGEVYALDAEGGGAEILAGPRAMAQQAGTNIKVRDDGSSFVFLFDDLVADDEHVLVSAQSVYASSEPMTRAERMDVETGRRRVVARAPVARASFVADHNGDVRFAIGADVENHIITYYRAGTGSDWELLNHQRDTGRVVSPIGFSADNATAYLRVGQDKGPDVIESMAIATGQRAVALRDEVADPDEILFDLASGAPIGVRYAQGLPRSAWFDPAHPAVRVRRSLEAAFPGHRVALRSATRDGRLQLVFVSSDRNPGDYYLFDTEAKSAELLLSRSEWLHPDDMTTMQPVSLTARDGLVLHGFLTVPKGAEAKGLPLVVHPHGGPIDVRDSWGFQPQVQMLASQGYAVLQVNFRGSAGFGDAFRNAGFRQWGRAMQDDLTDATRWAIAQGIADPERICLFGSSYGGYAALMGLVREPDLYRCAVGDIGVYDLAMMFRTGDIQASRWGENYLQDAIGSEDLDAISPAKQAERIRVPVLLAAGAQDERAPKEHTEAMTRALQAAGTPVETVIYPNEGHGYYDPSNRRDFAKRVLAFLARHLKDPQP